MSLHVIAEAWKAFSRNCIMHQESDQTICCVVKTSQMPGKQTLWTLLLLRILIYIMNHS